MHRPFSHLGGLGRSSRDSRDHPGIRIVRISLGASGLPRWRRPRRRRVRGIRWGVGRSDGVAQVFQTRIHGRGGQGVVTAAELLSVAAFHAGRHAQAFPSFGSERTGAPVVAYCRIDDKPIRIREPIVVPDAVIVQDPTLLRQLDVLAGLPETAYLLVNSELSPDELGLDDFMTGHRAERVLTVPATDLALAHIGRPVPNVALLGGFAALTGVVSMQDLELAVEERFKGRLVQGNLAAAHAAFGFVQSKKGATDAVAD